MRIRCISLWQPWASAIAHGTKRIETRGWPTRHRGPLLIHAAKMFSLEARRFTVTEVALGRLPERIPLGAIVAYAELADVQTTEEIVGRGLFGELELSDVERLYGDYSPGRYGWILENVRALEPIPYRGAQGLFDVPREVVAEQLEAAGVSI